MGHDTRLHIHTPEDPHRVFAVLSRILGAPPGGVDFTETTQPGTPPVHALRAAPSQGLNALLTLEYNPHAPLNRPGTRQVWLNALATTTAGNPGPLHADLILRAGAWLESRDHLWSWTDHNGHRHSGPDRFYGIRTLLPPGAAPDHTHLHQTLIPNAHDANLRDNL